MSNSGVKDVLFDHAVWATLSLVDVEKISDQLSAVTGPEFEYVCARRYTTGYVVPTFRHRCDSPGLSDTGGAEERRTGSTS